MLPGFAIEAADSKGGHLAFVRFVDPADGCCEEKLLSVWPGGEGKTVPDLWIEDRHISAFEVETAAIFLGDVFNINELSKSRYDFVVRKNEDLGSRDRVEPFLDPAPDDGEE